MEAIGLSGNDCPRQFPAIAFVSLLPNSGYDGGYVVAMSAFELCDVAISSAYRRTLCMANSVPHFWSRQIIPQ
jgi:hypothetical protein